MNIPLPDSGIPVQTGDDHFMYKGVYHPIVWINDLPYRPRVETLVIMNGNMVYVRLKEDDCLGSSGNGELYELPGGSIDADSTPIQQAENEVNEEALISIKNIYDTGLTYYANYPSGFLMNGGDTPLEYNGHISSIFVAEYNGIYNRNSVEKKDLDPKISENGKFYLITSIVLYLRDEHIDALLNSPYVNPSVKGAIRIIDRKRNPEKASKYRFTSDHVVGELFFASKDANLTTVEGRKHKNGSLHIDTKNVSVVRVFNSIDEALTGYDSIFGRLKNGDTIYIYTIDQKINYLESPSNEESPSSKITGEMWIKDEGSIKVKRLGLIRTISTGNTDKYYYGKNSTLVGELTKMKHEWVLKDKCMTNCMESSIVLPNDNKLYHGSTYLIEEFKPMSLDLGNAQQEPGWSTFAFADYTLALRFGLMRAIQKVKDYYGDRCKDVICSWNVEDKKPFISAEHYKLMKPLITDFKYYVYTIDATDLDVGIGNDENFPEYTFRESGVVPESTDIIKIDETLLEQNLIVLPINTDTKEYSSTQERSINGKHNRGWYAVMMTKDYNNGLASAQLQKAVKDGKLKPGDDISVYMSKKGISFDDDSISMRSYLCESEDYSTMDANFKSKGIRKLSELKKVKVDKNSKAEYKKKIPYLDKLPKGTSAYIFLDGNTYVGKCCVSPDKFYGDGWVTREYNVIHGLEVSKEYRGYSLGSQILDFAVKTLHGNALCVYSDNEIAISMYEEYGFKKHVKSELDVKSGFDDRYFMVLSGETQYEPITEGLSLPGKLYHGSTCKFDELRPTGIDFGNAFQEPGWSLFTWTKIDSAIGWAIFCVIKKLDIPHYGCINSQTTILPESSYKKLKESINKLSVTDRTFYVYTIKPESDFEFGLGHSSNTPNCITIRRDHIKPTNTTAYTLTMDLVDRYCKIVPDGYNSTLKEQGINKRLLSIFMKYDYMYQPTLKKQIKKDIESGKLNVGDDLREYLINNHLNLKEISIIDRLLSDNTKGNVIEKFKKSVLESAEYSSVTESLFMSNGVFDVNFEDFESGKSNIVLITGLSGSGKSTLGKKIADKYKAELIELDLFEQCYIFETDEQLKEAGEVFYAYLSSHKDIWDKLKKRELHGRDLVAEEFKFMDYVIRWCKNDKSHKYVLEGVQIYCYLEKEKISGIPILFVDTSALKSLIRRLSRAKRHSEEDFKNQLKELPQCIAWYIEENDGYEKFKKSVLESSTNNTISFSESFKDVKSIVDSLSSKELHLICNGVFKDSPYVIYRKCILIGNDPAAFVDVYRLPSMDKYTGVIVIACKSKYRNSGYASLLVNDMINWARKSGMTALIWPVRVSNTASINLAKKFGFSHPEENTFQGDRIEYTLTMENTVPSIDILFEEAEYSSVNKYPVFIILMHTGTTLSTIIRDVTQDEFSHAAISFNSKLNPMYSFGTKNYPGTDHGFVQQDPSSNFYRHYKSKYSVFVMYISKDQRDKMLNRLQYFINNEKNFKFDIAALVACALKIPTEFRKKFFCSRFCMEIIGQGIDLEKVPSLWTPQQMSELNNISLVNKGDDFYKYDYRITEKNLKKIKSGETVDIVVESDTPRSELPDEVFGLPEKRKYPLHDKSHVQSAIKFFNYVSKEDEKELAENILKKIEEYEMRGEISATKKNRFYPYLVSSGLMESLSQYDKDSIDTFIMNLPTTSRRKAIERLSTYKKESKLYEDCMYVNGNIVGAALAYRNSENENEAHIIIMYMDEANQSLVRDLTDGVVIGVINLYPDIDTVTVLDLTDELGSWSRNRDELTVITDITESWVPVMEAPNDKESPTDYTVETDPQEDDGADTQTENDDTEQEEESPTDYTDETDPQEDDGADENTDDATTEEESGEGGTGEDELSATDYTDETGGTDDATGEESSDASTTNEIPRNGNLIDNNVLKNYSVLNNFEKLYNLTKEVSDSMDSVVMPTKLQNTVLAQALKNLNSIKEFIVSYVKFQFSSDNYAQNLYYYNIVLQALNLNLELLKRNRDLEETKQSKGIKEVNHG